MTEPFQPREKDHLVEPMYQALREREGESPVSDQYGDSDRGKRVWLLVLALILIGGFTLVALFVS